MSLAALAAVTVALAAGQPPAEPLEPTAKAPIVIHGSSISRGWLRHWADVAQLSLGGASRARARPLAAESLISARWIRGEAAERGIAISRADVDRDFREQRDASFPRRREFRRFLRDSGQTVADIKWSVKTSLLTDRLRHAVTEGAFTRREERERLDAFVAEFSRKWRARTACRAPWVSESECGIQVGASR